MSYPNNKRVHDLTLILDVATRRNSTLDMLQRAADLSIVIDLFVKTENKLQASELSESDWAIVAEVVANYNRAHGL